MANIIITGANQGIGYYMTEKLLIDAQESNERQRGTSILCR